MVDAMDEPQPFADDPWMRPDAGPADSELPGRVHPFSTDAPTAPMPLPGVTGPVPGAMNLPLGGTPPPVTGWSAAPPAGPPMQPGPAMPYGPAQYGPTPYGPTPYGPATPDPSYGAIPQQPVLGGAQPPFGGSGAGSPPAVPTPGGGQGSDGRRSGARSAVIGGLVGAVVAALITGGLFVGFGNRTSRVVTEIRPSATLAPTGLDIQTLLAKVKPSVVAIKTGATSANGVFEAAGSGIIVSSDGLILTNAHVIEGATTIDVNFVDGSTHSAKIVGAAPANDLAVIRAADVSGLTPAEFEVTDDLRVGDDVVAIGNALNLGALPSVTSGIVSALDRSITAENKTLDHLIQTDAAINPGNSGGPLVNSRGQVVGVNTAIIEGSQNVGFSLSVVDNAALIADLKNGKGTISADSAFLGVTTTGIDKLTPEVKTQFGITETSGAFVTDVSTGSGADGAGLRPGDVILKINGDAIAGADDVGSHVRDGKPGDSLSIEIVREGEHSTVTATLGRRGG